MGRMILVEGLDLAGKSTLIEKLRQHYENSGWEVSVSHGDLCPDNPVAEVTRQMMRWDAGFTPQEGGPLFLASHLWDSRNFQPPSGPRSLHIQDSCALRTLAFERVVGQPHFAGLLDEVCQTLPRFDAALVLTASLETRKARFQKRAVNDLHDQFMFKSPMVFSYIDSELMHLAVDRLNAKLIVTDDICEDTVLCQALKHIDAQLEKGDLRTAC